jgi:hypothetical protein
MTMDHYNDDAFNNVIKGYDQTPYQQPNPMHDQGPYGIPANSIPQKPGLTKRGKVAIAVGVTVLATGGLIFWQHSNAVEAASQAKTQEIQLENKKLDLEMLKEMNQASSASTRQQDSQNAQRQKQISACVNTNKSLVGKQLGVSYQSVLKDCQVEFPDTSNGADMQNTASSNDAGNHGGGISPSGLIGIGAGAAVLLAVAANRGRKNNAA